MKPAYNQHISRSRPPFSNIPNTIKPNKIKFVCNGTTFTVSQKYQFIKVIGHGAYGVVASAYDKKRKMKVAIKKVTNAFEDLIDGKRILREIRMLSNALLTEFFSDENIINLVDLEIPDQKYGFNDVYIVTGLMETDLHRVIYSKQQLKDEHMKFFIVQIVKAVHHFHQTNVIHRDLKPGNILCSKYCQIKICDLGLARGFDFDDQSKTQYVVTRWYRAPEVILKASKYTKAVDIWSIGCIFAELLGRNPLFPGKVHHHYQCYQDQIQRIISILGTPSAQQISFITNEGALNFVKKQRLIIRFPKRSRQNFKVLFPDANPLGLDLMSKMLTFNPYNRITAEQCLKHPYLQEQVGEQRAHPRHFPWDSDKFQPTKPLLQQLIYQQAIDFYKRNKK